MSGFDLPGVIQLERVADSFPRKYDSAKRYGRNQACRHGEQGVQRVQISCVLVSDELVLVPPKTKLKYRLGSRMVVPTRPERILFIWLGALNATP